MHACRPEILGFYRGFLAYKYTNIAASSTTKTYVGRDSMIRAIGLGKLSARGGVNIFLGHSLSQVISAIGTIILVRLLTPTQYGLFSIALIFPVLISLFRDWGMGPAMIKHIAQYRSENRTAEMRRVLACGLLFKAAMGTILSLISFFLATFVATNVFHRPEIGPLIGIISITILAEGLLSAAKSAFIGFERMEYFSLTVICQSVFKSILAPLLVFSGYGILGAVLGYTAAFLITSVLGVIVFYTFYKNLRIENGDNLNLSKTLKTMFRFGLPISVSTILAGFQGSFYNFMIGIYCTSFMIGNFSAAVKFAVLITFITTPITTVLFPAFSKLNPEKEMKTLRIVFQSSVKYAALLTVPATAAITVLSKPLVFTLFGERYGDAPLFLTLFSISYLYTALGNLSVTKFIDGQGKTEVTMKLTLITLAIGLPLSLVLIPRFGIIGLILTNLVAGIPGLVTALWWIKKHFGVTVNWTSSAKIFFASATAAILTYIILSQLNSFGWIELFIGGTIFVATYLITTPLIGALDRSDINNLRKILTDLGPFTRPLNLLLSVLERFTLTPPHSEAVK